MGFFTDEQILEWMDQTKYFPVNVAKSRLREMLLYETREFMDLIPQAHHAIGEVNELWRVHLGEFSKDVPASPDNLTFSDTKYLKQAVIQHSNLILDGKGFAPDNVEVMVIPMDIGRAQAIKLVEAHIPPPDENRHINFDRMEDEELTNFLKKLTTLYRMRRNEGKTFQEIALAVSSRDEQTEAKQKSIGTLLSRDYPKLLDIVDPGTGVFKR